MVLIGYWPLNESSGASEAKDHSGNENHGTINDGGDSTIPGSNGIIGQNAYSFDGNNDHINCGNFYQPSDNTSISFGGWAKFDNFSSRQIIISQWETSGLMFLRYNASQSRLDAYVRASGDSSTAVATLDDSNFGTDEWHHWMAVADADSGKLRLYMDGREVDVAAWDSTYNTTSDPFRIGYYAGGDSYMKGNIAEIRYYNHALTPSEVQYLYSVSQRGSQTTSKKRS